MDNESRAYQVIEARAAYAARSEGFAEQLRREGMLRHRRSRLRWPAFPRKSRPRPSSGDVTRTSGAKDRTANFHLHEAQHDVGTYAPKRF